MDQSVVVRYVFILHELDHNFKIYTSIELYLQTRFYSLMLFDVCSIRGIIIKCLSI